MSNQNDGVKAVKVDDQKSKRNNHDPFLSTEAEAAALLKLTKRVLVDRRRAGQICGVREGTFPSYTGDRLEELSPNNSKLGRNSTPDRRNRNYFRIRRGSLGKISCIEVDRKETARHGGQEFAPVRLTRSIAAILSRTVGVHHGLVE